MAKADELQMNVVSVTSFTNDTANDFNVQLAEAKNAAADLIFLPIYYTTASLILSQANSMGDAPKFFGVDGILTVEGFDTSLTEGVMLLTPVTFAIGSALAAIAGAMIDGLLMGVIEIFASAYLSNGKNPEIREGTPPPDCRNPVRWGTADACHGKRLMSHPKLLLLDEPSSDSD